MSQTAEAAPASKAAAKFDAKAKGFQIMAAGQVESADFGGIDQLYCKYCVLMGGSWRILQGVDTGISQIACKSSHGDGQIVWNFPIDITFSSTNAHGWPRLAISVYGMDMLGRDVVRGYGQMHVPTTPGTYTRYVRMFKPCSSSWVQEWWSWLFGTQVEFYDSKFVAQGENRDTTRVQTSGVVKVTINVVTKGMESYGFTTSASARTSGGAGTGSVGRGAATRRSRGRSPTKSPARSTLKSPVRTLSPPQRR